MTPFDDTPPAGGAGVTGPDEGEPAISVVVAAFDAEATIGAQLAALARQRPPFAFEVLVCDNGSHDRTPEIVEEWGRRVPWLRLVDASARRGAGAARNIGVGLARSEAIAFCDADDVVADDWLVEMATALESADFVAARIEHRLLNPRFPAEMREAEVVTVPVPPMADLPMVACSHMGIRKRVFDEVGGFDESLETAEDLDLSWRVQLAGHRLVEHPAALVHVRYRDTLRGVFRQAYGWGRPARRLDHKYAHVFEARRRAPAAATAAATPTPARGSLALRLRRSARRAARGPVRMVRAVRSPLELAPLARRLGLALGTATGARDTSGPQLPADGRPAAGRAENR